MMSRRPIRPYSAESGDLLAPHETKPAEQVAAELCVGIPAGLKAGHEPSSLVVQPVLVRIDDIELRLPLGQKGDCGKSARRQPIPRRQKGDELPAGEFGSGRFGLSRGKPAIQFQDLCIRGKVDRR